MVILSNYFRRKNCKQIIHFNYKVINYFQLKRFDLEQSVYENF